MLVSLENITKSFGDKVVLNELNATIEDNDRIGLIGANGIGKSTLLNIIASKSEPDSGSLAVTRGVEIGMLEQNSGLSKSNTIYAEMVSVFDDINLLEQKLRELEQRMAAHDSSYDELCEEYSRSIAYFEAREGYHTDVKIKTILNGMGFADKEWEMNIDLLSGGEKTRLALAKLLLREPALLILDEPTNHLDFKTLMWLETYLGSYKGGLLIVSHDRYFLDKMVTKVWELENKRVVSYNGNYSKYKLLRAERYERMTKEYEQQQNKINSMLDYAQRNIVRASTSNMAKSRLHQLEHIERLEKPADIIPTPHFNFTSGKRPVKDVLSVRDLSLTVGERGDSITLCEGISFNIVRGDKVALIGPNGIGKSTLLKSLIGQLPQKGGIYWGDNVKYGYYEQENRTLDPNKTALEELWDRFPRMAQHEIRGLLGQVLITGDNAFKKIGVLSGGERARIALAIIMNEHPNVMLLDEPTNHLDLQSKEELEKSLIEYDGTLIFVSHDRYFLNAIPNKIIELNKVGLTLYDGNFDFYLQNSTQTNPEPPRQAKQGDEKPSYRSKQQRADEVKRKAEIRRLDNLVHSLEAEIEELQKLIALPEVSADYQRLAELCELLEQKKQEHETAFFDWAELSEEI